MSLSGRPALIYSRFSSAQQRHGISIERQYSDALIFIEREGCKLLDEGHFSDQGISAFKGKNAKQGALGELLALLKSGSIPQDTVIVVEEVSRLSRNNSYQALSIIQDIVNTGASIVTLHDSQVYTKEGFEENPMTLMMLLVHAQRAHSEAQSRSLRSKASQQKKRELQAKGIVTKGRKPFYLNGDGTHKLEAVTLVHDIIEQYLSGKGYISIAQDLNQREIPTPSNVGKWQQGTIQRLLNDSRLIGLQGSVQLYEPVIPEIQFQKIKQVSEGRRNVGHSSKAFNSCLKQVLTCKECGGGMQVIRSGSGKRTLRCRTANAKGCANRGGISYRLSTIFVAWCTQHEVNQKQMTESQQSKEMTTTTTQLEILNKQIKRLVDLSLEHDLDEISAKLTILEAERESVKREVAKELTRRHIGTFEELIRLQREAIELVERSIDGDGEIAPSEELNRYFRLAGVKASLENRGGKQGVSCGEYWATLSGRENLTIFKEEGSEPYAYIKRTEDGTEWLGLDYYLLVVPD